MVSFLPSLMIVGMVIHLAGTTLIRQEDGVNALSLELANDVQVLVRQHQHQPGAAEHYQEGQVCHGVPAHTTGKE